MYVCVCVCVDVDVDVHNRGSGSVGGEVEGRMKKGELE